MAAAYPVRIMESMVANSSGVPAPLTAHAVSQLAPDALFAALGSRPEGLSATEAAARISVFGPNQIMTRQHVRRWLGPLAVAIRP